jgi:hypothetical protein
MAFRRLGLLPLLLISNLPNPSLASANSLICRGNNAEVMELQLDGRLAQASWWYRQNETDHLEKGKVQLTPLVLVIQSPRGSTFRIDRRNLRWESGEKGWNGQLRWLTKGNCSLKG